VYNPAFDVTPASLVTSLIIDRAVLTRAELAAGALPKLLGAAR
jgi:methylthioribose-1-phosphate isomerase